MRELADSELVRRALEGEELAYRALVERFQRPVWSLIVRMVKDPSLAEDIAQEAFLKAFSALSRFEPEHRFSSWLFKIAHNTALDALRQQKLRQTVSLDSSEEGETSRAERLEDESAATPEADAENRDLGRELEGALAEVRPEYREVIVLRFQEGLAYEEIAEVMSLPLGTVKTYIHRARKELAAGMRRRGYRPSGETERGDSP
ncbi:MAG: sigma-70 family RNA polymerase sigma factor [Thermoanaerobaculia bacterium]|mgnify:CR=1 FL=1